MAREKAMAEEEEESDISNPTTSSSSLIAGKTYQSTPRVESTAFATDTRRDVLRRDKFQCWVCGERNQKILQAAHLLPSSDTETVIVDSTKVLYWWRARPHAYALEPSSFASY